MGKLTVVVASTCAVAALVVAVSASAATLAASPLSSGQPPPPTGVLSVGSTLTAQTGSWSGDTPISFAYQWQDCTVANPTCTNIAGATASTYVLATTDTGFELRVEITATNDAGSAQANSNLTGVVTTALGVPVGVVAPSISGTAQVGATLTASAGTWSGQQPITETYAWQRCDATGANCLAISGATNATYVPASGDAGATLRVVVSATNTLGSVSASSDATGVVSTAAVKEIAIGSVSLPDRLVIDKEQFTPDPVRSRTAPITLRVHVSDTAGNSVGGALVYALPVPSSWAAPSEELATSADGWVTLELEPKAALPLASGNDLDVFLRARKPSEPLLAGVSTRRLVAVPLAAAKLVGDPYTSTTKGFDVSFPNCGRSSAPGTGFYIVGANDGRPFTTNPCFAREYAWAQDRTPAAVYVNTGYQRQLLRHITAACRARAAAEDRTVGAGQAFALGCSEATTALPSPLPSPAPSVIWLDVEPSNPWSSNNELNAATVQGLIAGFAVTDPAAVVGIYSRSSWWNEIAGGWRPAASTPEWIPRATGDPPGCPASFAAGAVWLSQGGGASIDTDTAC